MFIPDIYTYWAKAKICANIYVYMINSVRTLFQEIDVQWF